MDEWGGTRMKIEFDDNTCVIEDKDLDTFFVGFNTNLFLRRSCYECKYAKEARISDFTIGDYWGVPLDTIPDLQRRYGVSLILANSEKGKSIIKELSNTMYIKAIEKNNPVNHNQALRCPSVLNKKRDLFFKNINQDDFDKLIYRYNWKYFCKIKIKSAMLKLLGEKRFNIIKNGVKKIYDGMEK